MALFQVVTLKNIVESNERYTLTSVFQNGTHLCDTNTGNAIFVSLDCSSVEFEREIIRPNRPSDGEIIKGFQRVVASWGCAMHAQEKSTTRQTPKLTRLLSYAQDAFSRAVKCLLPSKKPSNVIEIRDVEHKLSGISKVHPEL